MTAVPLGRRRRPLTPVFVRLKLSLLRNGLRQSGGRRAAYITSAVLALLFAALQLLGLIALRGNAHAATVVVLRRGSAGARLDRDAAVLPRAATRPSTRPGW